jgi:hypothetical protein
MSVSSADFLGEVEAGVESIRQGPACTERLGSLLFIELLLTAVDAVPIAPEGLRVGCAEEGAKSKT